MRFLYVGAWAYIDGRRFVFIDNSWDAEVMPSVLIDPPREAFWRLQGDILGSMAGE